MLNYLWAGMMAVGILWGAFHGNMAAVTDGALESTKDAVTLCITMLGIMSFWCGILKIGEEAGLIEAMTAKMKPVIRFLFPKLPEDHPAAAYISTNMIANMLGLGWKNWKNWRLRGETEDWEVNRFREEQRTMKCVRF